MCPKPGEGCMTRVAAASVRQSTLMTASRATRLLIVIAMFAVSAVAQSSVKEALAKHWKTSGEFTVAVAEAMPAGSYSFRPNPEEMSFGQLMAHIANADLNACAIGSGLTK